MAFTLQKKDGSPFYYVHFRYPSRETGEPIQVSRSTKERTKSAAWAKAAELEKAIRKEHGCDEETNSVLYAILSRACGDATKGELNEAKASEYLSEILQATSGKPLAMFTVREWLTKWLEQRKSEVSKSSVARYRSAINCFLDWLPEESQSKNITQLTTGELREFRQSELEAGLRPQSVKTKLVPIRAALSQAVKDRVISFNPADSIDTIPADEFEKDVFSPCDLKKILSVASPEWKGMVLVGYYLGPHIQDASNLLWRQVDLSSRTIRMKRGKTGKAIKAPIHDDLHNWLMEQESTDDPEAPIFPSLRGVSVGAYSVGLSAQFSSLLETAGIEGRVEEAKTEGGKGRRRKSLGFSCLRHTFNSAMANAGVDQEIRMKLAGQSSNAVNDIYTHLDHETFSDAVHAVPSLFQEGGDE
ncbi:tyrosine-type recombinase/integrase [Verrucomicrobiales bacterium]|nr:tyrosine-type recombinase/integrase [Verrucomicrobiales bacterium]